MTILDDGTNVLTGAATPTGDRIEHVGGGWYAIFVAGEHVDQVRGQDAAAARLTELASGSGG